MELEVARQMYELAMRREEGTLTSRDREILSKIDIPSLENSTLIYQAALQRKETESDVQSYIVARNCRWAKAANEFMENYYTQKGMGMTTETDLALCERATKKLIPIDVIRLITHHSANWMSANGITSQRRTKHGKQAEDQSSRDRSYISAV